MENILLLDDSDVDVKIIDFGFAKVTTGADMSTPCGSPGYIAPEILLRQKYGISCLKLILPPTFIGVLFVILKGKAVDMWSLGIVAYLILVGYPPFHDRWVLITTYFDLSQDISFVVYRYKLIYVYIISIVVKFS